MIVSPHEQNTPDWIEERCGIPTSSQFARIVTPTGKPSAAQDKYMAELCADWALGPEDEDSFRGTHWVQRGRDLEPEALRYLRFATSSDVRRTGLIWPDDTRSVGSSPDGLNSFDEPVEIKCPMPKTHLMWLSGGGLPRQHVMQCQGQLWVTGAYGGHFLSYCPKLPPLLLRVARDERLQMALDRELPLFVAELAERKQRLRELGVRAIAEWRDHIGQEVV